MMITRFYVFDETSEIWSDAFFTREDAEKELREEKQHNYGLDAKVIEVNEIAKEFILIDSKDGDQFEDYFDTAEEAIEAARIGWNQLSNDEKKHRDSFYVLRSINPDREAENHFDGEILFDAMKEV